MVTLHPIYLNQGNTGLKSNKLMDFPPPMNLNQDGNLVLSPLKFKSEK